MLVLGGPLLLSLGFGAIAAPLDCVRDGDLSMAGEAGDRELDDVEEVAGRFLGLLSLSIPVLDDVLLTPLLSAIPFLCFRSFGATPCLGLTCSEAGTLLFFPVRIELRCSACATLLKYPCSINLLLPTLLSKAARMDFPPDIFSGLGVAVKHKSVSWLSTTSPILSSVGEEWDSSENLEGELERSWSLAEWDQDGFDPFSLRASGLAIEDLEENVCL